jgi:hypothetical protein
VQTGILALWARSKILLGLPIERISGIFSQQLYMRLIENDSASNSVFHGSPQRVYTRSRKQGTSVAWLLRACANKLIGAHSGLLLKKMAIVFNRPPYNVVE